MKKRDRRDEKADFQQDGGQDGTGPEEQSVEVKGPPPERS